MTDQEFLATEWPEVKGYVSLAEIVAINALVTQPDVIDEVVEYEDDQAIESLQGVIEMASESSAEYSDGHDDDFGFQQFENLQNLYETEFKYLWRSKKDVISLSSELMHRIAVGHPFEEGNKRTAYLAATIFLIVHQATKLDLKEVAIPELDSDLLDSLEDIAEDGKTLSPKELANVYRKSLEEEIKELIGG